MADGAKPRRTRVERGIYRQANGNFAVCARRAGRLHFRTAGIDLVAARRTREDLIAALEAGRVPASPRLRFDTRGSTLEPAFRGDGGGGRSPPPHPGGSPLPSRS
jgi:hypothetical protein